MPVGKFNYTERISIRHRDVAATVGSESDKSGFWFDVDIDFGRYRLPGDALVFVEAHRKAQRARFRFGTVENIVKPSQNKRRLDDVFTSPEGILFRVKVTNPADGRILAEVDRVRAGGDGPGSGLSMLPVDPMNLEQECWRINFEGERPVLEVNRDLRPDWRTAIKKPEFAGLVYPAVLREILTRMLWIENHPRDDEESWATEWRRFAENKLGMPPPPDDDDRDDPASRDDWVSGAVAAFSRRISAFRRMDRNFREQEERE